MTELKKTLWTKNYSLITFATILGAIGNVAIQFTLAFLVFDETQSTFASAVLIAVQLIPSTLLPLLVAPLLDRFPRKPFLVGGDAVNGILYLLAGLYLWKFPFTYGGYMIFSFVISCMGAIDNLAYTSLYPKLIPEGFSQKGYTVSQMVFPAITVIMTPLSGVLYIKLGVSAICAMQGILSLAAAWIESHICITETTTHSDDKKLFSVRAYFMDIKEALLFLKKEKGLQSIYAYMAVTNGVGNSFSPLLVAFFRTTPGFSIVMYSAFAGSEFLGRTLGGLIHYHVEIPEKKRFSFAFLVYQFYECMDAILLFLPYPLMLVNRAICGFLGINSASLREASVQNYIPDDKRAKINALSHMLYSLSCGVFTLIAGALGEVLDYRLCLLAGGIFTSVTCWCTIFMRRSHVKSIYNKKY